MSMVQVCLAVWNLDRNLAVHWFIELLGSDLRPACSHYAEQFCNLTIPEFAQLLSPIIASLVASPNEEIAKEGAKEASARWLFYGLFDGLVDSCVRGSQSHKTGVATIAAHFLADPRYSINARHLLLRLANDASHEVRELVSNSMQNERVLSLAGITAFLTSFVRTRAFGDNPGSLLYAFHNHPGSLTEFADVVFATVASSINSLLTPVSESKRRAPLMDQQLVPVLLRLYEQASNSENDLRSRCLDGFDDLLEKRIVPATTLIKELWH
jgi:hypothetical protein